MLVENAKTVPRTLKPGNIRLRAGFYSTIFLTGPSTASRQIKLSREQFLKKRKNLEECGKKNLFNTNP
uniref:Uncharacterized protein n=1 Tax=Romanomermis culicivorax TaxID=13658 RepID=A0A915L5J1_ROMCU